MAAVTEFSHRWASTFRLKWRACSLPFSSLYRGRYVPSGLLAIDAIAARLPFGESGLATAPWARPLTGTRSPEAGLPSGFAPLPGPAHDSSFLAGRHG